MSETRDRIVLFFASSGYLGHAPIVPGTFGTLPAIALLPLFAWLQGIHIALPVLAFAVLLAASIWIADRADHIHDEHDSRKITIDEIAGYGAAVLFLPSTWEVALVAFVLFRIFDIVKIWPANQIDKQMGGGAGVVLDDVAAGVYSNLALRAIAALAGWPLL